MFTLFHDFRNHNVDLDERESTIGDISSLQQQPSHRKVTNKTYFVIIDPFTRSAGKPWPSTMIVTRFAKNWKN